MTDEQNELIAIEEILPSSCYNFFLPQCTGRMGYVQRDSVPEILRGKSVIQLQQEEFERLMPFMESVSDITYR